MRLNCTLFRELDVTTIVCDQRSIDYSGLIKMIAFFLVIVSLLLLVQTLPQLRRVYRPKSPAFEHVRNDIFEDIPLRYQSADTSL